MWECHMTIKTSHNRHSKLTYFSKINMHILILVPSWCTEQQKNNHDLQILAPYTLTPMQIYKSRNNHHTDRFHK